MMDIYEIQEYLPHRYPFLLVDRVVEVEPGGHIVAYKNISNNEPYFQGHFPGRPVFPGVLVTEAMAQVCGILGFKTMDEKPEQGKTYMFVGADDLRFRRLVIPGDQLRMEARVLTNKRGIWKFEAKSHVDDELVCKATLVCAER